MHSDPDVVFEAAESIGLAALRAGCSRSTATKIASINWATSDGALWVLKFYRPARWSDAQIGEEHAFTLELAAAELPVAAPIERDGESLFEHQRLRFAAFPYLAGRAPELDDNATLTLLGRTLARMHAIGNRARVSSTARRSPSSVSATRARDQVMRQRLCTRGARRTICARQ